MGTVRRPVPMLLALLLVLLTAATALGVPAGMIRPTRRAAPPAVLQDPVTIPGLAGDDACDLLSDDELLRATNALSVVSRTPGGQSLLPAGCDYELEPRGEAYGTTWQIVLGVTTQGGAARFEQDQQFSDAQPIAGLGDRATIDPMFGAVNVLRGDVYLTIQVIAFGGEQVRPGTDMARLLMWRITSRLGDLALPPAPSPSPSPEPVAPERALVERLRAPEFGEDQIASATEILARSGIATYANPDDLEPIMPITGPASPLTLLGDQVRAMALEAWAGGGFSGADLDALAPSPAADLAGGAEVVAGYVGGVDTEGARVARLLMGAIDPAHPDLAVFPQLVLMLMVSDVARDNLATAVAAGHVAPQPVRAVALAMTTDVRTAAGGICSAVTGFIDAAISRVFDALKASVPDGGAGRVVVSIWNFVVSVAESAARVIVKELIQPVLDVIADVAGVVGLAATIVSAIRPWTLSVTSVPPVTAKGGQAGQLVVRVDLGGMDEWPATLKDCAETAGKPLPNLKPEGAPVTWSAITQAPVPLVAEGSRESTLDADGIARFDFVTLREDVKQPWEEQAGRISVRVTVERTELEKLRNFVTDQIVGQLPRVARAPLTPWVRSIIASVSAQLDQLVTTQQSGSGWVIYHTPLETPEPPATPEPPDPLTQRAVMVRIDREAAPPLVAGTPLELYSCDGPYGDWSGVLRLGGLDAGDGFGVPFADFPMAFSFSGSGGVQSTRTAISGTVPTVLPTLSYNVAGTLTIVVDGDTMSISGVATAASDLVGASGELGGGQLRDLPIEPAPDGTCP